jgi:hypothetical protein
VCCTVQISSNGVGHCSNGVDAAGQRITREALEALAGAVVGMYPSDCDMLAVKAVDFTAAAATKDKTEKTRRELIQTQTAFLKATLCPLDRKRHEEPFQCIYC